MPSDFAQTLAESLPIKDRPTKKITLIRIDLAMLKVSQVLGHAQYRNHDHKPDSCEGCAELEKVVESLRIR